MEREKEREKERERERKERDVCLVRWQECGVWMMMQRAFCQHADQSSVKNYRANPQSMNHRGCKEEGVPSTMTARGTK
jgi:hypothetical protein